VAGPLCWTVAAGLCIAAVAFAQPTALADAVKATYLLKFAPFVAWPGAAGGPFTICTMGEDAVIDMVAQAAGGQTVEGRPVTVQRIAGPTDGHPCRILFVTGSADETASTLEAVRGTPVLTVTDAAAEDRTRGVINFVIEDHRVRFEIDEDLAERDGLTISSKLLALAVSVRPKV
jgi:hypothetical protein